MAEIRDRTYTGREMVKADGTAFVDCRFESAVLRYSGGKHPEFRNCTFGEVGWYFAGATLRTIQLLQQVNASPANREFIANLFTPGNYLTE